jgi:uncharacterized protein with PIN domain
MNRFIVDGTSGDIVKWLRILGFDVDFIRDTNKTTLVAKALYENKILISRSSSINRNNSDNTYYINKEEPIQILIDMKKMGLLKDMKPFRRCI